MRGFVCISTIMKIISVQELYAVICNTQVCYKTRLHKDRICEHNDIFASLVSIVS